ncbi:MAG: cell envelope integrity protein TolA [Pseudomonadota bacterium]
MNAEGLRAIIGSVVVHIIVVAILVFTMWERPKPPAVVAVSKPIIQARAVDEATAMEPVRRRETKEQLKKEAVEKKRKAAVAEKKRKAEVKRKKIAAEKKRKAELKRKKAEAEKKRQVEVKRKQKEAEKKRLAEKQRKKDEAAKKKRAEEERQRRENELKRQMDAEAERIAAEARVQRRAQLNRQQLQYISDIANKVQRNWLRPPGSTGTLCSVLINQIPGGEISGVRVTDCDGDTAFQRSVEAAVRKASPLPIPADPELFQREIQFDFKP